MLKKNILFCGPVFVFLFFVLTPRSAPGARVDFGLANISFEVGHVKRELFWISGFSRVFQFSIVKSNEQKKK